RRDVDEGRGRQGRGDAQRPAVPGPESGRGRGPTAASAWVGRTALGIRRSSRGRGRDGRRLAPIRGGTGPREHRSGGLFFIVVYSTYGEYQMKSTPGVPSPGFVRRIGEVVDRRRGVDFQELKSRTLLNRLTGTAMPFGWTVNPFRGCEFGCRY